MKTYTYGIIGENGPIEGVTVQSFVTREDTKIAKSVAASHGGEVDKHISGVHRGQMTKRFVRQGATETRFFPIGGKDV